MKYVIEFDDEPKKDLDENAYYSCKQIPWWGVSKEIINRLTPYTEPDRKAIEDEVWEFAGHLINVSPSVTEDIYWSMNGGKGIGVAVEMTYQEAKARYDSWKQEKEEEIHVGDEVEDNDGTRGIVFGINGTDLLGVCWEDERMSHFFWPKTYCRKTGRHFSEAEDLLKKIRE